jgi:hypothetical protein
MPQTQTPTAQSLLREVVRVTLLSRTDESIEGQLFVIAQIQREHASSLRKYPELRQALCVIASDLYRDWLASSEGQYFQLLSSQLAEVLPLINSQQASRSLAGSKGTLRSAVRYYIPMKPPPKTPEFERFTEALRQIVQVPKKKVEARMNAAKRERQRQRGKRASGHASRDKD